MSKHMIIERQLKEKLIEKENEEYIKIKLTIKNIQKIVRKKIQKFEIVLYNSSLGAEATCEFTSAYYYLYV